MSFFFFFLSLSLFLSFSPLPNKTTAHQNKTKKIHAPDRRVGARHERVRPKVQVEHRRVGALDQDPLSRVVRVVDRRDRVGQQGQGAVLQGRVLPEVLLDVVVQGGEAGPRVRGQGAEALLKGREVFQVARARAVARGLARVRGPDPPPRRPDRSALQLGLAGAVHGLVEPEEQVRPVGKSEPSLGGNALLFQVVELVKEAGEVDDDAVADDAGGLLVEDPGGDQVELVLLACVVVDGVAGVGAALGKEKKEMEKKTFFFVSFFSLFFSPTSSTSSTTSSFFFLSLSLLPAPPFPPPPSFSSLLTCALATTSKSRARMSTSFPLPSSPHCAPKMAVTRAPRPALRAETPREGAARRMGANNLEACMACSRPRAAPVRIAR